jgi:hypothetical protein
MKIDKSNYELFMIDYIEGKLHSPVKETMQRFITENPDIAQEIEDFQLHKFFDNSSKEINKSGLYKSYSDIAAITETNFEEHCIAYLEKDLDKFSVESLLSFIGTDPGKKKVFDFYRKLKFEPDTSVKFPNRRKLKKQVIPYYKQTIYMVAFAASILILIMVRFNIFESKNEQLYRPETAFIMQGKSKLIVPVKDEISKKTVKYRRYSNNSQLSVIDTVKTGARDEIRLTLLNRREIIFQNSNAEEKLLSGNIGMQSTKNDIPQSTETPLVEQTPKLLQSATERFFLRALQLGIKGIGNMTETMLVMRTELDENGNLSEIGISTGGFEISRKLASNSQKN